MIGCLPTQALAFLAVFVYATHAPQAIAFEWKPGLTVSERHAAQRSSTSTRSMAVTLYIVVEDTDRRLVSQSDACQEHDRTVMDWRSSLTTKQRK